jgi:hypothetical protein
MWWLEAIAFYFRWFWLINVCIALLLAFGIKLVLWVSGASDQNKALDEEVSDVDKSWDRSW